MALAALGSLTAAGADATAPANLVTNPGFEVWAASTSFGTPAAITDAGMLPAQWLASPETQAPKDNPGTYTGAIHKDATVKHSGNASLRLESGRGCDIIGAMQWVNLEPNTKYDITFWYKGDNIQVDGDGGVLVWAVFGPKADYWNHMTFNPTHPAVHDGTFDWTKGQFTIDTKDTTSQMILTLQLRRATGKLWYDDIQVTKAGAVTTVPSF